MIIFGINFCSSEYQNVFNSEYDDFRKEIEDSIKTDPKTFFKYLRRNLKKNRVVFPSVKNFENKTASTNEDKCELFAEFIQRTYSDDQWVPSDYGPTVVTGDLNGSVGSIADLKPKGPGFESRISQGFFLHCVHCGRSRTSAPQKLCNFVFSSSLSDF
jgi:hypothetical protein